MELILTVENAISKHETLKLPEESIPIAYRSDQMEINGILLVTNLRISFYYIDKSAELRFSHYLFNMISKIKFYPNSRTNIVEINHDYEWTTFIFRSKMNTFEFREFINKNFNNKLEVSEHIKDSPMKNKVFDKEEKVQTEYKKKKKLIEFENKDVITKILASLFIFALNIIGFIIIMYFTSIFFPQFYTKTMEVVKYPAYWINVQRCEKDMFTISAKMNMKGDYPQNLTDFILKNFKIVGNKNPAKDPWGNLYDIEYQGNNFKIISYGPDKIENTKDDTTKIFAKINK